MTTVDPHVGVRYASLDAHRASTGEDDGAPRLATGLALGTAGVATSFMPAKYARGAGRQAVVTVLSAAVGFGAGSLLAAPASQLAGGGDAVRGGLLIGGAGLAAAIAGRHLPNAGAMHDVGRVVTSLGTIAAVGGGAVAATEALEGSGLPLVDAKLGAGLAVGLGLGGAAMGVLALRGGYRPAPSVAEAARSVLRPSDEALAAWTPELAKADYTTRSAAARTLFEELPGVTDGSWARLGKGKSFLRGVATLDDIRSTMGDGPVATARRLVVSAKEVKSPEARAALMLERFDAAGGVKYGTIHVISPAAIGDTDEVVPLAVEHARRGDVITLMTQTSQTEPYFVLHKVPQAQRTLDLVLEGLHERIEALPVNERPELLLSALCYGALSPVELGMEALRSKGVQHTLLEGTPALRRSARTLAGQVGRGEHAGELAFTGADLDRIAATGTAPELTMLKHRDDPLRVGLMGLLVPASSQEGRPFVPVMSAINSFGDFGIDQPKRAGELFEVGHRFQATGVRSANAAFGLGLDSAQVRSIEEHAVLRDALRGLGTSGQG